LGNKVGPSADIHPLQRAAFYNPLANYSRFPLRSNSLAAITLCNERFSAKKAMNEKALPQLRLQEKQCKKDALAFLYHRVESGKNSFWYSALKKGIGLCDRVKKRFYPAVIAAPNL
jgi:hypothetical protein